MRPRPFQELQKAPESRLNRRPATCKQWKKGCTTAAGRETPGERAQRASKGLTREQLEPPSSHRQTPENSLTNREAAGNHRKTAGTTAGPPE